MFLACITATPTFGADEQAGPERSAVSLRWENDTFGKTDANYTNGLSLALTRTGDGPIGGVWNLLGEPGGKRFASYELTQLQFTPADLKRRDLDPNDRPYAGVLYAGLATYLRRAESLHGLKVIAGVVGPASLSEALQKTTHDVFGYTLPRGWDNQLKNEPIFNLLYEYRHKFVLTSPNSAVGVELIPMGGAMLGNYLIQAQAGAQCRIGYHLPDDFGTTVLRGIGSLPFPQDAGGHRAWGVYAFAGGGASLVARNITLDGNNFVNNRGVGKRLLLPAVEFGGSLWTRLFQTSFSYVMSGREFNGQKNREDYGSVLFSYFF